MGLFALQEGVAEGSVRDETEDAEASEGDEEIPQHEPGPDGESVHDRLGRDEHVAGAVDGADEGAAVGVVFEFGAEAVDVDVEGVLFDLGERAPTGFDELFARGDEAGAAHEGFEELELLSGERDLLAVSDGYAAAAVEGDAGGGDGWLLDGGDAAGDGADAGEEDLQDEGFDEVIVGTEVEGVEDLGNVVDGCEDEDGGLAVADADTLEDFEAVHAGEKDVEERGVVLVGEEYVGAFAPVVGESDAVSIADEGPFDKSGDALVVFDNQHVHVGVSRVADFCLHEDENAVTGECGRLNTNL